MVDFCGWEMPIQYKGIIHEHLVVRNNAGIFDVSHMGRILIEGPQAESFLDFVSTNKIAGKKDFSVTYTVLCDRNGGCIDDVLVYRENPERYFIIANASNRNKDLDHLGLIGENFSVSVDDRFIEEGILAIQGPKALSLVSQVIPKVSELHHMHFALLDFHGHPILLSRTGYTGEDGCEVYGPHEVIIALWEELLKKGVEPIGLGARDTLRLEMGYALYGHEINENISPTESVATWAVKLDKDQFLGKDALEKLEKSGKKRWEYGVILLNKGIAREGYSVVQKGQVIGRVTSGTYSPSLQKAIAIVLVNHPLTLGDQVSIRIREQMVQAEVVKLPFYRGKENK